MATKTVETKVYCCDICNQQRSWCYTCDFCKRHYCPTHESKVEVKIGKPGPYQTAALDARRNCCSDCEGVIVEMFEKLLPEKINGQTNGQRTNS